MLKLVCDCSKDPFVLGFIPSLTAKTMAGRVSWCNTSRLLTTIRPDGTAVQFATIRSVLGIKAWRLISISPEGERVFRAIALLGSCSQVISAIDALFLATSRGCSLN